MRLILLIQVSYSCFCFYSQNIEFPIVHISDFVLTQVIVNGSCYEYEIGKLFFFASLLVSMWIKLLDASR